jgi:hypothetical protein
MTTLTERLTALAKNPKARAAIEKARGQAAKPENRARIEKLRARWAGRRPDGKG